MPPSSDQGLMPPLPDRAPNKTFEVSILEGTILSIIFRNEQNGYTVCSLDGEDEPTAVGILPYLGEGETVRFFGRWIEHPDYGEQFQVEHYEQIAPKTESAILHYLSSGLIKGIGEKTARRLIKAFGADTLDILREQPERVARMKGIGSDKAEKISRQLLEKKEYQDMILLLSPLGIGPGKVLRIYRRFGSESIRMISEDPYRLADEVFGIGFLTADLLARRLGLDPQSPGRIASALRYVLIQSVYNGHTYLPRAVLIRQAAELLQLPLADDNQISGALAGNSQIILSGRQFGDETDQRVSLASLFLTERMSADKLALLLQTKPAAFADWQMPEKAAGAVAAACSRQNLELAPEQNEALLQVLQRPVLILTGGPGTGKTTIIKLLCDCLRERGGRVLLAAPTGRAARRMAETSGMPAKTLHRLLELQFTPDDSQQSLEYRAHSDIQLACDLLIVDEASMIDAFLFKSLLEAVVPGTRLVLVGDADQLPSVGPGYVLKDLIDSGRIPVVRLTRIFRQSAESLIIRNAHRIHAGEWPEMDQSLHSQFLFIPKERAEDVAAAVIRLVREILPQQYHLDPQRDVQVLTPARKGPAGMLALNLTLQQVLMPPVELRTVIKAHGISFGVGDKVMQIRNNYDLVWRLQSASEITGSGVFNGETGTVRQVDAEEDCLDVLFDDDRLIRYDRISLDDLELAYAMTVHKSQGSEYPVVVLAVPAGAPQLLTRNLLYTAVTRARQKLLLVSSRRTLGQMLANNQAYNRHTLLRDWLAIRA